MARILLNVDLNAKPAQEGLSNLKRSITLIAKSFTDIKPDQALTDQIKALSDYYQKIAEASKNARESLHAEEIQQQRLAEATAAANRARAEERTALTREREATTDLANAQERLEEIQQQHEHNQQRRQNQQQQQNNQLLNLEKRYADLVKQIQNAAEKYPVATEALGRYGAEVSAVHQRLVTLNESGEGDNLNVQERTRLVNELTHSYAQYSARLASVTTLAKEQSEENKSNQKEMDKWVAALDRAEKEAEQLKTTYYGMQSTISNLEKQYPAGTFDSIKTSIANALTALNALDRSSDNYVDDVQRMKTEHGQLAQALAKTKAETDKLDSSIDKAEKTAQTMKTQLYNMLTTISNIENRYPSGTFDQLKADIQAQIEGLNNLNREDENYVGKVEDAGKRTDEFRGTLAQLRAETEHATPAVATLGEKFGNLVERYAKFYASSLLVRKPLQLIQNALSDVGETLVKTEDAVIELNRVLDDPQPTQEVANRLYDIAYAYGSTFENASTIASNFARSGRSWNESLQATEAALLAMNVAELNATEASDGLLSIIAQFDMKTSDLIDVVDKLNKTADKNPVSTQKLLQAIQRAGSAAKNANVSFDQTLGLITAISEATNRSGQNIGTAVNSLIQYSTKNVDVFATLSKESEEMVEKFKLGLVSIVDVWNQVAKDIHNDKEARDNIITALGTDGLEELSSTLHDELGDLVSEIDGVYNVANTYRKNYFIALLDNMERFMKVQEQLTDYQGYSQEENEKYMETYTAKVNQLNDAWQKLANDEQGILKFKKDLVDLGIDLVGFVEQTGGIVDTVQNAAGIIGGLALITKGEALLKLLTNIKTVLIESFTELRTVLSGAAGGFQATVGWIGLVIAVSSALNSTINSIRASQAERRKETLLEFEANKDNITALSELKKKYDEGNLSLKEEWELEDKIVPLLGDKGIALDGLAQHTEAYTKKVWELVEGLREEQKLTAQVAQDAAKDDYIEAARQAVEGSARAQAKRDGGVQSFILNSDLGKFFSSAFSGAMNDADQAAEYLDKLRTRLDEAKQAYLEARGQVSDAEEKKLREYYQDLLEIYNNLSAARDNYEKQRREGLIAELEATDNLTEAQKSQLATLKALNEEHIIGRAGVVPPIQEETAALEEAAEAAEEAGSKYDKAAMGADAFAESLAEDTAALKADADAIAAVRAAQEEFNENGGLSIETISKLASLGSDWVDVLFDENGAVDVNSNAIQYLLAAKNKLLTENGVLIDSTEEETAAIEKVTEQLKDYSAQIDDVQNALSVLDAVQAEYDETGSLSIDTLQKLLELGGEYLDLIIDEEGQIRLNQGAVDDLVAAKQTLLEKLIEEQTVQYAVTLIHEKMAETEEEVGTQAENAAKRVALMVSQVRELAGDSQGATLAMEGLKTALAQLGAMEGVSLTEADLDEIAGKTMTYNQGLRNLLANAVNTSSSGWRSSSGSSSSSSSSSKSTKDEYLEDLKAVVSLRESELTLMEHQGASQDEQIAKIHQIQEAIHTEADYLRSIGASQEDINKLSSDWWKWQEKIVSMQEKSAEAAKKAAEEAKKAAEEAEKAETARLKQVLADDKARLTLMEKQGKSVSERVEKMKEIQAHLHDEAEWLRKIGAEQSEIDALSAEWWDWQEKILKLYKETLEAARDIELEAQQKVIDGILAEIKAEEDALELSEKRLAIDEKRADLEDAIAKAKLDYVQSVLSDYITALDDAETLEEKQRAVAEAREKLVSAEREARSKAIIDAFKAEKDVKSDTLSLEEKRLAVEKARQALIDAENNRTTRVYNESTGQWEYQADAKAVQSAQDNLTKAVDALNAYVEEQAWNEVAEAVENGSVSEAEVLEILSKWAKEAYGNGSPEFVAKIQSAFRKAMGTAASPDSVSGQISAVDNAVKSLNDYLKAEAVKELKAYIAAGNTDAAGMKSILDKWLSMGEGAELYQWRDGLLDSVNGAIESGYYDDSKVQSQIQAVENAVDSLHEYLRNRFIREIEDLVKNGTAEEIRAAIEKWSEMEDFDLAPSDLDWATRAADAVERKESTQSMWDAVMAGDQSSGTINWVLDRMKKNSAAWWDADKAGDSAEKKRLSDENYTLGTMMGWHRKDNGHWYDQYDRQVYDRGGVLHGKGGIKATNKPEIILDPELTAKILRPGSEAQFRAFADAMHLMFERGGRTRAEMPVIRNPSVTDSHNTSYVVNGIPISSGSAERYTIAELFRMLPMARS